jgi:hypothetical protein
MANRSEQYRSGDWVIYLKQKSSTRPALRARTVMPSSSGETYRYAVEKYWIVDRVRSDGSLILRTRRGKLHQIRPDDPNLRRANLLERLCMRKRFSDFQPSRASRAADRAGSLGSTASGPV